MSLSADRPPKENELFHSELFADGASECVFDLEVARYRRCSAGCRIQVNVVVRSMSLQMATAINEAPHELSPLHSEMDSSCFS